VPEELLSGNPETINEWRYKQSIYLTQLKRPQLKKDDRE
jgi:tRNA G37 N-methylase TrmD